MTLVKLSNVIRRRTSVRFPSVIQDKIDAVVELGSLDKAGVIKASLRAFRKHKSGRKLYPLARWRTDEAGEAIAIRDSEGLTENLSSDQIRAIVNWHCTMTLEERKPLAPLKVDPRDLATPYEEVEP